MEEFKGKVLNTATLAFTVGFYKMDNIIDYGELVDFMVKNAASAVSDKNTLFLCEQIISANQNAEGVGKIFICDDLEFDINDAVEKYGLKNETAEFVTTYMHCGEYYIDIFKITVNEYASAVYETKRIGEQPYIAQIIHALSAG